MVKWEDDISTHSLTRRLTNCVYYQRKNNEHFNSQPHKEADTTCFVLSILICISTHSLTRRLTHEVANVKRCLDHFNSQPHKEADGI